VQVRNCEVTLIGTVESKDAKRRVEDIGESVSGVKNVENTLRVKRNAGSAGKAMEPVQV
jgi:osmotically-inducible protein OsmY